MLEQPLGALHDVGLVSQVIDEDILLLEKLGILEQAEDLAEEGNGLLVELLGVPDVGVDDLGKGQAGVALGEGGLVLLRLYSQLAADGVLGGPDVGIYRVES